MIWTVFATIKRFGYFEYNIFIFLFSFRTSRLWVMILPTFAVSMIIKLVFWDYVLPDRFRIFSSFELTQFGLEMSEAMSRRVLSFTMLLLQVREGST